MTDAPTVDHSVFLRGLIGKRYVLGARGPDSFDCYGLARHIMIGLNGPPLPADLNMPILTTRDQAEAMMKHPEREKWPEIAETDVKHLDLVLMGNVRKRDFHLGVFVQPKPGACLIVHADPVLGVIASDIMALKSVGFNYLRFFRYQP